MALSILGVIENLDDDLEELEKFSSKVIAELKEALQGVENALEYENKEDFLSELDEIRTNIFTALEYFK